MSDAFAAEITESADAPPVADVDEPRRQALFIEMQGLHKRFGADIVALDEVDLTIKAGEFFTLLGPSGCGKTTLLRILASLEEADAGELSIGRRTITEVPPHQRSVITLIARQGDRLTTVCRLREARYRPSRSRAGSPCLAGAGLLARGRSQTLPGLLAGTVLVAIPAFGMYVIPELFGGGKGMMLGNLVATQFSGGANWPLGPLGRS